MTLISERTPLWLEPPSPSVVPTLVVGEGPIVALRQRPVIAMGALLERGEIDSPRLVSAVDLAGRPWWIPADAVWSDADVSIQPQHPRPTGLATGRTRESALHAALAAAGLDEVHDSSGCTACDTRWYSHRARGDDGRFATTAWLEEG